MIFNLNESKALSEPKGGFIVEGEKDFGTIEVKLPSVIDGNAAAGLVYKMRLVNAEGGYLTVPLTVESSGGELKATARISASITFKPQVFYPYVIMTDANDTLIGKTNFVTMRVYPVPEENREIIPPEEYERIIDDLEQHLIENTEAMNRINEFSDGEDGESAYEIAVDNGFVGTPAEWLLSLKGERGDDGKSAYEVAVENGYQGTEQEWLAEMKNYERLNNLPQINNVELSGNKSLDDLGIQKKIIYENPPYLTPSPNNYVAGDLFYYNQKIYKYQGTSYDSLHDISRMTYDVVGRTVVFTTNQTPPGQETTRSVSTYRTGDIFVNQSSPPTNTMGRLNGDIYICSDVLFNKTYGGSSIHYAYSWKKLPLNATTLAEYEITDAQTKIDSSHKLSSDLVDDTNNTNKFVTAQEKSDIAALKSKTLVIPEGTTTVTAAMVPDKTIKKVILPDSLSVIDRDAFDNCESLSEVYFGTGAVDIGERAFCGCKSLKSIYIKRIYRDIGEEAFAGCFSLTSVFIGGSSNPINIGDRAFEYCASLSNLFGSFFIANIGNEAFKDCVAFNGILNSGYYADDSVAPIAEITSIGAKAFNGANYPNKIFTIPDNMTTIGASAFRGCRGLEALIIPSHVTAIEDQAFIADCKNLTDVVLLGTPAITYDSSIINAQFNPCMRVFIPAANLSFFISDPVWSAIAQNFTVEIIENSLDYLRNKNIDMTKYGYSWP